MNMKTIAPNIWPPPISIVWLYIAYLVGSQQTYFQLRAAFLSLAPSSAIGYYATPLTYIYSPDRPR